MRERAAAWGAARTDASPAGELDLPGMQQEGLCVDGQGRLWVADDRAGSRMRFDDPGVLMK